MCSSSRSRRSLTSKKAAKASGEKSVEMVHVKELLGLTGYVRGGCSPVGMKKAFPTVFDESVLNVPTVMVSAGKIGYQVECAPADLIGLVRAPDRSHHDGISPAASGYSANTVCTPQPVSCASFAASVSASSNSTKCAAPSRSVAGKVPRTQLVREKYLCAGLGKQRRPAAAESGFPSGEAEGRVKSCDTGWRNAATRCAP